MEVGNHSIADKEAHDASFQPSRLRHAECGGEEGKSGHSIRHGQKVRGVIARPNPVPQDVIRHLCDAGPSTGASPLRQSYRCYLLVANFYYYKLTEWFITPILVNGLLNL